MVDTWPDDGGWEIVLVIVRLPRFGERRMLPVDAMIRVGRRAAGAVHALCRSRMPRRASIGVHRAEDP